MKKYVVERDGYLYGPFDSDQFASEYMEQQSDISTRKEIEELGHPKWGIGHSVLDVHPPHTTVTPKDGDIIVRVFIQGEEDEPTK